MKHQELTPYSEGGELQRDGQHWPLPSCLAGCDVGRPSPSQSTGVHSTCDCQRCLHGSCKLSTHRRRSLRETVSSKRPPVQLLSSPLLQCQVITVKSTHSQSCHSILQTKFANFPWPWSMLFRNPSHMQQLLLHVCYFQSAPPPLHWPFHHRLVLYMHLIEEHFQWYTDTQKCCIIVILVSVTTALNNSQKKYHGLRHCYNTIIAQLKAYTPFPLTTNKIPG